MKFLKLLIILIYLMSSRQVFANEITTNATSQIDLTNNGSGEGDPDLTVKEGERTILTNTTSSGKLNIDSNYQTFEVHSGVTKTNSKLIPNVGLTGSFSITPGYDESKYYSWRNRKVGNVSVFFSDKYNLINNENNNFNVGWLLDFRNSMGDKSQVYSINGTTATYRQDNALTRETSLVANLGYEKKITDNGKFTAGISAKNTNQDVKSLSGNLGFKLIF